MMSSNPVLLTQESDQGVLLITLNRPEERNCVHRPLAEALSQALRDFERNSHLGVAIMTGAGGNFCSGADLKAFAADTEQANRLAPDGDGPMGPTRMHLGKPVIAAIEGCCVAGGLELALWCDLRVASETAYFGVYCRRFGVPLIDGGTVRLPRLIGQSHAMDMILTGRRVDVAEAWRMGLVNRQVGAGKACEQAMYLAKSLLAFPQTCLRRDRLSVLEQWGMDEKQALQQEFHHGMATLQSGETVVGAKQFRAGLGRHGQIPDL